MSKFQLKAKQVQVITTEDGKEFDNMDDAITHQALLDAATVIELPVQAYLNTNKMIDRNRKQKQTVVESAFAFLVAQGIDLSNIKSIERTVFDTPAAEKVEVKDAVETKAKDTSEVTEEVTEELF